MCGCGWNAGGAQPKTECGPTMLTKLINIAVWMSYMKDVRLRLRARKHNGQSQMNEEKHNGNRFNGRNQGTAAPYIKSLDGMCVCKRSYVTMEYHDLVCLLLRLRQSQSGANNCISTCPPPASQKFVPETTAAAVNSLHLIYCYPHISKFSMRLLYSDAAGEPDEFELYISSIHMSCCIRAYMPMRPRDYMRKKIIFH